MTQVDEKALAKRLSDAAALLDESRFVDVKGHCELLREVAAYLTATKPVGDVGKLIEDLQARANCVDQISAEYMRRAAFMLFNQPAALSRLGTGEPVQVIRTENTEAGFEEVVLADRPTIVREGGNGYAVLLDMDTRLPIGIRYPRLTTMADFPSTGNEEAEWIAAQEVACPHCGGSGHKDDVQPAPDVEKLTRERDEAQREAEIHRLNSETNYTRFNDARARAEAAEKEAADLRAQVERLKGELRRIAEGNLGDDPWQANYARIREVARAALSSSPKKEW